MSSKDQNHAERIDGCEQEHGLAPTAEGEAKAIMTGADRQPGSSG